MSDERKRKIYNEYAQMLHKKRKGLVLSLSLIGGAVIFILSLLMRLWIIGLFYCIILILAGIFLSGISQLSVSYDKYKERMQKGMHFNYSDMYITNKIHEIQIEELENKIEILEKRLGLS